MRDGKAVQYSERKARIVLRARKLMQEMGGDWATELEKSSDETEILIMDLGLIYMAGICQGMVEAKSLIEQSKARVH